jgi:hypothetical protein
MEGPMIVGRIVVIKTIFDHLIDEPAVDAFIEVWRLNSEQEKAQNSG